MRMQGVIRGITAGTVGYDEAPRSPRVSHSGRWPGVRRKKETAEQESAEPAGKKSAGTKKEPCGSFFMTCRLV